MRKIASGAAVLAAALVATAAAAEEPFGSDVWLASPQLCQEAKAAGSVRKVLDDGNLVLSAKGLRGADFLCRFVQVLKAPDIDAWVATSLCRQEGGGDFPNLYSVSKGGDGRLTLVTVYDDEEPATDSEAGDGAAIPEETDPASPPSAEPDASTNGGAAASGAGQDGAGDAAIGQGEDGTSPEAVGVGDVYTRCEGVPAP